MATATDASTSTTTDAVSATDSASTVTPEAPAAPAATPTIEQLQAELETWKGHSRTWEDRAKANKDAADRLTQLEREQMTKEEQLEAELNELKTQLASTSQAALRSRIAGEKGVPEALLSGTTEAELTAAADALIAFRGPVTPPANDASASGQRGVPVGAGAPITSRAELAGMSSAEIRQARQDGRLDGLLGKA